MQWVTELQINVCNPVGNNGPSMIIIPAITIRWNMTTCLVNLDGWVCVDDTRRHQSQHYKTGR